MLILVVFKLLNISLYYSDDFLTPVMTKALSKDHFVFKIAFFTSLRSTRSRRNKNPDAYTQETC